MKSPFLILLSAAFAVAGCGKREEAAERPRAEAKKEEPAERREPERVRLSADDQKTAGIRTEKLEWTNAAGELAVTGSIQPNLDRLAQVAPRVPGRVVSVQASLGDKVSAGQPLATLDSLEVGEARSALSQAEADLRVAEAAYKRAESLRADSIVPEKEYLRAKGDVEKSRAAATAAREKVRMLGVGEPREGEGASMFRVSAPFAGTVVEKTAVPGGLADPAKPIFTVADLSTVWIDASIFEKDLPRLAKGATAAVTTAAWPGEPAKGRVTYISSLMDRETRTVKARIEVPNKEGRLRPGMFANAAISVPADTSAKTLLVPEDAIVLMDGKPTVFVRRENGFEPRTVTPGERRLGRVELKDGLDAGAEVVVAGAFELKARLQRSKLGDKD